MNNTYNLTRFVDVHIRDYALALAEIKAGKKESHWMWYIFPQIQGLGKSSTSQYYAIKDIEEAKLYVQDSYLGVHLKEISQALLDLDTNDATEIFGKPDDMKLRSSMTLFSCACEGETVFDDVLRKYFNGNADRRTLALLNMLPKDN